jgi:hypothetical protein
MKQRMLGQLDKQANFQQLKRADRLSWKGTSVPPVRPISNLAAIQPSTSLTKSSANKAGAAMAVGIVLDRARELILYQTIKSAVNSFSSKVQTKFSDTRGAILVVHVAYLKVATDIGRSPSLKGVSLVKALAPSESVNHQEFINERIFWTCNPSITKPPMAKMVDGYTENRWGVANLFVECLWD